MASPATGSQRYGPMLAFRSPAGIAVTVIAVMALVALAYLFVPRPGTVPIASGAPTPSATATAEPTPSASPAVPSATPAHSSAPVPTPTAVALWTGLAWSSPVTPPFIVHLNDLIAWGDGYVAVGSVEVDDTRSEAAFLTSPDGLRWTIAEQHDPGIDRYPRHLVALGDELFAFSHRATMEGQIIGAPPGTYHGPLFWSSTDGETWTRVDSPTWHSAWAAVSVGLTPAGWDNTQYPITTGLVDVASGPDGIVAIGNSYGDAELLPVILHSTDGSTWSDVSPSADDSALLESISAFDGGYAIAGAAHAGPRTETSAPAIWISPDGQSWDDTAPQTGPIVGGEFGRVVAGADGLIAWAGPREMHTGPRFTSAWTSPDGRTWSPSELPNGVSGLVAADGTRIVALGPVPNLAADPAQWPGISEGWVSTDGVTWTPLDMPKILDDFVEGMWLVPDGVIYAGVQSFWFGTATVAD